MHSARHRIGAPAAARAFGLSDGRAESPLETEGRLKLMAAGLPAPRRPGRPHREGGHGRGWPRTAAGIEALLATSYAGPRRFTVVRCLEPGGDVDAA